MASVQKTPMEEFLESMSHIIRERKHVKSEPMPVAPGPAVSSEFPTVYVPAVKPVDTPTKLTLAPNILPDPIVGLHPLSGGR